jgi:glycerol-1-phosphate dehydrogenase [NAD(P)+]
MHGISRPASGCEHQLAHHWEVELLNNKGRETALHGNFVALGTRAACRMYELAREEYGLSLDCHVPSLAEVSAQMDMTGGYSSAEALGVNRELFYESFFHATKVNERYTLITWLQEKNRLADYAKRLTDEFF